MVLCDAEVFNSLSVLQGWVSFVLVPQIMIVCLMQLKHIFIAAHFGQDGSRTGIVPLSSVAEVSEVRAAGSVPMWKP